MARLFDTYLFVDWSARSTPSPAKPTADAIWSAELAAGSSVPVTRYHRTRQAAGDHLLERLRCALGRGGRVLVGCDFPYGYPAGFAGCLGPAAEPGWRVVWRTLADGLVDRPDNGNDRFELAGRLNARVSPGSAGPFWGCPVGRSVTALGHKSPGFPHIAADGRPLARVRACEARLPGTQETWKLYGAGSVGSQALTGIPRLRALRGHAELAAHSRVWPFETGFTRRPGGRGSAYVVHAEIWPGIVGPEVRAELALNPQAIRDAVQVATLCHWADGLDRVGRLGACFAAPAGLSAAERGVCLAEEGWVLGA